MYPGSRLGCRYMGWLCVCIITFFSGCFALRMSSNVWQILIQNANTTLWRGVSEETMTNTRSYDLHDHQWFSSIDTNNIIGQKLMNNNGKHLVQYVSVITSICWCWKVRYEARQPFTHNVFPCPESCIANYWCWCLNKRKTKVREQIRTNHYQHRNFQDSWRKWMSVPTNLF